MRNDIDLIAKLERAQNYELQNEGKKETMQRG